MSSTPSPTTNNDNASTDSPDEDLMLYIIIGILSFLIVISLAVLICCYRRRQQFVKKKQNVDLFGMQSFKHRDKVPKDIKSISKETNEPPHTNDNDDDVPPPPPPVNHHSNTTSRVALKHDASNGVAADVRDRAFTAPQGNTARMNDYHSAQSASTRSFHSDHSANTHSGGPTANVHAGMVSPFSPSNHSHVSQQQHYAHMYQQHYMQQQQHANSYHGHYGQQSAPWMMHMGGSQRSFQSGSSHPDQPRTRSHTTGAPAMYPANMQQHHQQQQTVPAMVGGAYYGQQPLQQGQHSNHSSMHAPYTYQQQGVAGGHPQDMQTQPNEQNDERMRALSAEMFTNMHQQQMTMEYHEDNDSHDEEDHDHDEHDDEHGDHDSSDDSHHTHTKEHSDHHWLPEKDTLHGVQTMHEIHKFIAVDVKNDLNGIQEADEEEKEEEKRANK